MVKDAKSIELAGELKIPSGCLLEYHLPDDPARQKELLDQLTEDGFRWRTNAGPSVIVDILTYSGAGLPSVKIDYSQQSPVPKARIYPEADSNLIETYGATNVARVMGARISGSGDSEPDVSPHFVADGGAYALFAREAEQSSQQAPQS